MVRGGIMVYNSGNTKFATKDQLYHVTPKESRLSFVAWLKDKETIASKATKFGGKRLLGTTDKGKPIYVSFNLDRESLQLEIKLTHDISTIRKSNLCPRSVHVAHGETVNIQHEMRPPAKKGLPGEVTQRTLDYIDKLMSYNESKIHYIDNKISKLLFMKISHCIYPGNPDKFRWMDVMKTWELPEGEYFTV
jgi:hypothetical protein